MGRGLILLIFMVFAFPGITAGEPQSIVAKVGTDAASGKEAQVDIGKCGNCPWGEGYGCTNNAEINKMMNPTAQRARKNLIYRNIAFKIGEGMAQTSYNSQIDLHKAFGDCLISIDLNAFKFEIPTPDQILDMLKEALVDMLNKLCEYLAQTAVNYAMSMITKVTEPISQALDIVNKYGGIVGINVKLPSIGSGGGANQIIDATSANIVGIGVSGNPFIVSSHDDLVGIEKFIESARKGN